MSLKKIRCTEFWDECMGSIGYQIEDFLEDNGLDRTDIVEVKYAVVYDTEEEITRSYCLLLYEVDEPEIGVAQIPLNELEQDLYDKYGEYFERKEE